MWWGIVLNILYYLKRNENESVKEKEINLLMLKEKGLMKYYGYDAEW